MTTPTLTKKQKVIALARAGNLTAAQIAARTSASSSYVNRVCKEAGLRLERERQ